MNSDTIIAIDPSLRCTGFAILRQTGSKIACLQYGTIKNPPKLTMSQSLLQIHTTIRDLLVTHGPQAMAIESVIYVQSYQTAITLGSARGAAVLAAAEKGIPIHEYAPRRVKQAVVGRGGAAKNQVGFMVRALLGMTETPPEDAADAIAIGMTHFQSAAAAALQKKTLPAL